MRPMMLFVALLWCGCASKESLGDSALRTTPDGGKNVVIVSGAPDTAPQRSGNALGWERYEEAAFLLCRDHDAGVALLHQLIVSGDPDEELRAAIEAALGKLRDAGIHPIRHGL